MKRLLDQYISRAYPEVRAYTAYFLSKMGLYIDADTVINNSYIHVLTINDYVADEDKVKSYLLNTIKYQILWSTSKSHKDDRITAIIDNSGDRMEDDELADKIREDKMYSFNKGLIEIYRSEIKDQVQKIVFEVRSPENTQFILRDLSWFRRNEYYDKIQKIRTDPKWFMA